MEREELQQIITNKFPEALAAEGGQWLNLQVPANLWPEMALWLRDEPSLACNYLFCLTCIDRNPDLEMVYHLRSLQHGHNLVVKSVLNRENPIITSVSNIWRTAEFHEREVYEMFGVAFTNHPDLRKLILPDDWEGFPLRKDYEDPINMIKL